MPRSVFGLHRTRCRNFVRAVTSLFLGSPRVQPPGHHLPNSILPHALLPLSLSPFLEKVSSPHVPCPRVETVPPVLFQSWHTPSPCFECSRYAIDPETLASVSTLSTNTRTPQIALFFLPFCRLDSRDSLNDDLGTLTSAENRLSLTYCETAVAVNR